ncbi:hypothetical protein, partial [Burkholderia stabilis]
MPDLFTVSGYFPGNPKHARVAWKIPGYLEKGCQPGKTLIIPPAPAHSAGLAAYGRSRGRRRPAGQSAQRFAGTADGATEPPACGGTSVTKPIRVRP